MILFYLGNPKNGRVRHFVLLWLQISVDDAEGVEVLQGQGELGQVELDVLLGEHDLEKMVQFKVDKC